MSVNFDQVGTLAAVRSTNWLNKVLLIGLIAVVVCGAVAAVMLIRFPG